MRRAFLVAGALLLSGAACGTVVTFPSSPSSEDGGGDAIAEASSGDAQGDGSAGDVGLGSDADGAAEADDAAAVTDDASGTDAQPEADAVAGGDTDAGVDAGGAPDASPCGDATNPCVVVPDGWTLVAFATTQATTCPAGFGQSQRDLVEGPDAGPGACACGTCSVTAPPSCASGSIDVFYDVRGGAGTGACGLPGSVTPLGNSPAGACLTDIFQGRYSTFDLKYMPPLPTGGACQTPGVPSAANVTYASRDRRCNPDSAQSAGCDGGACAPGVAGPYRACIDAPGALACPPGPLTERHLVGTDEVVSCGPCSCAVTAQCAGTLTIYTDTACTNGALPIPVDGACHGPVTSSGTTYRAYTYAGAPQNVACQASGTSAVSGSLLANQETICCAP